MELINYKTLGEKKNPPLLIIHGLFGSLDNWNTLAKRWSEDLFVITIDVRNHGRSFHSKDMSFKAMNQDIVEVLNREELQAVNILGHSMGGKIAMYFASEYPDRVLSLILVDIAPYEYPHHHNEVFDMLSKVDLSQYHSRAEIEDALSQFFRSDAMVAFMSKNISRKDDNSFEWKFDKDSLAKNYDELIGTIPPHGFDKKVLFLAGEESDYITPQTSIHIPDLYPNYELEIIPNAGHWVHSDNPDVLYHLVLNFIKQ